jgi:hypothetical protein
MFKLDEVISNQTLDNPAANPQTHRMYLRCKANHKILNISLSTLHVHVLITGKGFVIYIVWQ